MVMSCSPSITGLTALISRSGPKHNYFSCLSLMLFFSLSLPTLPPTRCPQQQPISTISEEVTSTFSGWPSNRVANIFSLESLKCLFWLEVRKHFMSKNDHLLSISWGEVALRARNKKSALRKALKLFVFVMKYSSCYSSLLRGPGRWGEDSGLWPELGASKIQA